MIETERPTSTVNIGLPEKNDPPGRPVKHYPPFKMVVELEIDPQDLKPRAAENMVLLHLPTWVAERGRMVHIKTAKIVRRT